MIIAVANQKGGTGKSTTAQAIATGVTHRGRKTLAVDIDPQGNMTLGMGCRDGGVGAYELLTGKTVPSQAIQHTEQGDIIAASATLAAVDTLLKGNSRLYAFRAALEPVIGEYDVIVVDCPPTLNVLLLNALAVAERVIIPITSDMYALQGLYQLVQTIREAQVQRESIFDYAPRSKPAKDYSQLLDELGL